MTEHEKLLDLTAEQVKKLTDEAFADLLRRIRAGEDPQPAIQAIMQTWEPGYREVLAASFSATLGASIGPDELRDYPIGEMRLSQRLYQHAEATTATVREIVRRHAAGFQDARTLTLQIFEGYGFQGGQDALKMSPRNPRLPKYLRREILTDPELAGQLARHFAKVQASQIKTPALKAAYLEAIDAMERGRGDKVLAKRLDVAYNERMRYFANRIAQTELHRAHTDQQAEEIMADESIEAVKFVMSQTHPRLDICDLYASQDKYGLGPGIYPKEEAPQPPLHPFCRCNLHSKRLIKVKNAKPDPASERKWLHQLKADQGTSAAARVVGSRAKLQAALKGGSVDSIINAGRPAGYKIGRLGAVKVGPFTDVAEKAATTQAKITPHEDSIVYVIEQGKKTGKSIEFASIVSADDVVVLQKKGGKSHVSFTGDEFELMRGGTLYHNHPASRSLSLEDLKLAAEAKMKEIVAAGHDGTIYRATAKTDATSLKRWHKIRNERTRSLVFAAVKDGRATIAEAERWHHHVVNTMLNDAGVISYRVTTEVPIPAWVDEVIKGAI